LVTQDEDFGFPGGDSDERELLLSWLGYLRGAVVRKVVDLSEEAAHWTPGDAFISLLGVVNHLTHVEWRWVDGGMRGQAVSQDEGEFHPGTELTVAAALEAYRIRATRTDHHVRSASSLAEPCCLQAGTDLRWVVLHLINETARHAGHADVTRQLLDGLTGE
jgi:uncharacterized damage-inducible protein DinB